MSAAAPEGAGGLRPLQVVLPSDPHTPRTARAFVLRGCQSSGVDADRCDTVELLTSELVTNAIRHASGPVRLSVDVDQQRVLVAVGDDDARHPTRGPLDTQDVGGRGIAMVDLLATSWGVRDDAVGKTVWFVLDRS